MVRVKLQGRGMPAGPALGGALAAGALALAAALPGCASAPQELAQLRTENELLREELRIVRQNCSYYRDLDVELDAPSPGSP